jgi:peptidoglycan/LPS O-acetylase OafA/YrhL
MTPKYRPDIDGLRALAVLSVLFFHAGFAGFSGGYVGVDIFFVISGFLITTIISREIGENTFSLTTFYERRFRRILPAAFTMVAASLLIARFILNPEDYDDLARSAIASNLFVSNIFFYLQTGYFDGPASLKPLLHTWTLSVEEQYYILFPLLLLGIAKFGYRKYLHFLIPVFVLSFGASVLCMDIDRSAVFYMLPTRAWELLTGSLLAIAALPRIRNTVVLNAVAGLGLLLMLYSIFSFTGETPFPGGYALIPAAGAALVIYTGNSGPTLVNQLLSIRPLVFVGLISYSLYLWHWPLIVYARILKVVDFTTTEQYQLLVVTFILAVLSWRYIETPFRNRRFLQHKGSVFAGSLAASVVVVLSGLMVIHNNGFPGRYSFTQSADLQAGDPEWNYWMTCRYRESYPAAHDGLCRIGKEGGKASFIIWGDSHARALASAVNASAIRNASTGLLASLSACPPLQEIERPGRHACYDYNQSILNYVLRHPEIDTVILAARWAISTQGSRYKHEAGDPVELVDVSSREQHSGSNPELFAAGLRRTIRTLQEAGKEVVLVRPVPEVGYDVPAANYIARITGRDVNRMIAPGVDEYVTRNKQVLAIFSRLQKDLSVATVDPAALLCDDKYCRVALQDGTALYRDDDHLSTYGSRYVSSAFDQVFSGSDPADCNARGHC